MDKIYIIDETKHVDINVPDESQQGYHVETCFLSAGIPERNTESGTPNYTKADYTKAYANGQIIAAEIAKAYSEGYRYVRLKTGEYPLCASSTNESVRYQRPAIFLQGIHGIDVDFGGSKLRVINDSDYLHPYHKHSYSPTHSASTLLLTLYNCTDVHFHSAKMIGDVADRSWSNADERRFEGSSGIMIEDRCANIEISNITFSMWMNNAITNGSLFHNSFVRHKVTGWQRWKTIDPSTGDVIVQEEGARPYYVSGMIEFDTPYYDVYAHDAGRTMRGYNEETCIKGCEEYLCFRGAPTQSNFMYMPFMDYPGFTVFYYRRNDQDELVYDSSINMSMLSNNFGYINIGAYDAMRILIRDEETDLSEVEDLASYFMIMVQAVPTFGLKIHDCIIRDTHKGGVSNLPSFCDVYNNTFINCSKDCGINVPIWDHDYTRFCIDLEDIFSTNVVIRDNRFESSFIAMMLGCDEVEVCRNLIIGCVHGVSIRFGSNFNIHDNKITGTSNIFDIASNMGTWRGGVNHITNINVHGNYFEGDEFKSQNIDERRYINFRDNLFILRDIDVRGGDTDNIFTNCKFVLKPGSNSLIFRNTKFENCILSSNVNRTLEPINISGSLYMKNIAYSMQANGDNIVDGIHFGPDSSLYVGFRGADYDNTVFIKNCVFESMVEVIYQTTKVYNVYVTDSVFLGDKACKANISAHSDPHALVFTAYNTKFHCSYENIFEKLTPPNRTITYNLANCIFEYPK